MILSGRQHCVYTLVMFGHKNHTVSVGKTSYVAHQFRLHIYAIQWFHTYKCSMDPVVSCSQMLTWFSGFVWSRGVMITNVDVIQWFQAYKCWCDPVNSHLWISIQSSGGMLTNTDAIQCFHAHWCCKTTLSSALSLGCRLAQRNGQWIIKVSRFYQMGTMQFKLPNNYWDKVSDQPNNQRHCSLVDQGNLKTLCESLHHSPCCTTYMNSRRADHPACKSTCATHFCFILIKTHLREYKCEPIILQAGESVTPPPTVLPAAVSLPHRHFKR